MKARSNLEVFPHIWDVHSNLYFLFLTPTVCSNTWLLNLMNCQEKLHIHTFLLQEAQRPIHHIAQLQVRLPSLLLLSLDPLSLTHMPSLRYLPICIYCVTSCPVPSNYPLMADNKVFPTTSTSLVAKLAKKCPKSQETRVPSLMSLYGNVFYPHCLLHLKP